MPDPKAGISEEEISDARNKLYPGWWIPGNTCYFITVRTPRESRIAQLAAQSEGLDVIYSYESQIKG